MATLGELSTNLNNTYPFSLPSYGVLLFIISTVELDLEM